MRVFAVQRHYTCEAHVCKTTHHETHIKGVTKTGMVQKSKNGALQTAALEKRKQMII